MKSLKTPKLLKILSLSLVFLLSACGGSSNEDQSFPSTLDEGNSSSIGIEDEDFAPVTLPDGSENTNEESQGDSSSSVIDDFLWKPISESTGNIAILVNPRSVRVEVTGDISETLSNTGPSNGRGTTARGRFPGCRYGDNVLVEFFTSPGARIKLKDGRTSVRIADGCKRVEFRL